MYTKVARCLQVVHHNSICVQAVQLVLKIAQPEGKWTSLTILYHHFARRRPAQTRCQEFAMEQ
jgi:hypothetical protein